MKTYIYAGVVTKYPLRKSQAATCMITDSYDTRERFQNRAPRKIEVQPNTVSVLVEVYD